MPPVISIVGNSGAGKTTLIEKLIPALKKRGYAVGVVKHAHHGFEMDKKGKDSWRHQQAGADTVIVASSDRMAMVKQKPEISLDFVLGHFHDVDLVLAEGYKREHLPKIEIFRSQAHETPICVGSDELAAFVSDREMDLHVPCFGLEDIGRIAGFIAENFIETTTSRPPETYGR